VDLFTDEVLLQILFPKIFKTIQKKKSIKKTFQFLLFIREQKVNESISRGKLCATKKNPGHNHYCYRRGVRCTRSKKLTNNSRGLGAFRRLEVFLSVIYVFYFVFENSKKN
jgi:hypothetical protein